MLTIDVAVLLAVIAFFRLRRRTQARSRNEEMTTALTILALGVLLAPTPVGQWILDVLRQLTTGISEAGR
ncbi:hypothetical protein [Streptomyces sp. NPDC050504]|uniref:hypothetical protein n=1 Tax=Streptomyces sp. NPDC050504 TaxID=3365618 RepID=UPI0037ACF2BA